MIEELATTPVYGLPAWMIVGAGLTALLLGVVLRYATARVIRAVRGPADDGGADSMGAPAQSPNEWLAAPGGPEASDDDPSDEPKTEPEPEPEPADPPAPSTDQDVSRNALYETLESNWHYLGALAALGAYAYVAAVGPTVLVIIFTVAFAFAFALIPILSYTIGSSLPAMLAEPVGTMLISVGLGGIGQATMRLSDGRYKKHVAGEDSVEDSKFYSFGLGELAFGYKRDPDMYGSLVERVDVDTLDDLDQSHIEPGKFPADTERNGYKEYIDTRAPDYSIFVRIAHALSVWQDSASIDEAHIGENKARQEHSKQEASGGPNRTIGDRLEWFFLFMAGVGIGWVFFF